MQAGNTMGLTDWVFLLGGMSLGLILGRRWFQSPSLPSWVPDQPNQLDQTPQKNLLGAETSLSPEANELEISEPDLRAQLRKTELAYYMAAELCQFQSGFLARASHELRSPINNVISLHQLILADLCETPEEERDFIAQASVAAQRMLSTLDELITVSKVRHGRIELEMQPVNMQLLLEDVYRVTHLQVQNRNLRLEVQDPPPDLYVLADLPRLRQVLISLIEGAIAAMGEGWIRVTVSSNPDRGLAEIVVADDRPEVAWSEALDLLKSPKNNDLDSSKEILKAQIPSIEDARAFEAQLTHTPLPSGLVLLVNRAAMETMNGSLTLIPHPTAEKGYGLCCSIPLLDPEAALAELED
jgi:signal transduction histidine kinase